VTINCLVLAATTWVVFTPLHEVRPVVREVLQRSHRPFGPHNQIEPTTSAEVVFVGDSITELGAWRELFPGITVRNQGVPGDTADGVLERVRRITAARPEAIFLLIGTNDLQTGRTIDEITANVALILARINAQSPGTHVFVQSVLPRGSGYRARIEGLNRRLERVVGEYRARWIDLYPLFLDPADGSIRDDLAKDELHLSAAGYGVWRDHIAGFVARLPVAQQNIARETSQHGG
jgi:lysophospholipase L1-like esterase